MTLKPGVCTDCGKWTCEHVDDELARLRERVCLLETALRPFADAAGMLDPDVETVVVEPAALGGYVEFARSDFDRAEKALA